MFQKLLIANRGEIACRVIRTARRMGIATVAVYSDADADALHVRDADEAVRIGPAAPRDSYLNGAAIIDAARQMGARAVHPGYGFLAENADFAAAVATAGLVFVGPSADAIRAMGSKAAAKQLMELAGVPVVPGYHGDDQHPERLADAARQIGYPVLIKAWAGGGGKGMRVVERPGELAAALAGAQREALSAFGDDRVLIEKYLERPRHIEVQVFGDRFNNVVHLHERDCSVQRRHQKVIEEAPAFALDPSMRRALHEAAVTAARAVRYVNAGTIEFIVEGTDFYFMEMNTRLQVEHPVTEMITGLDLVEWQLRVAAGEALPLEQDQITARGHAVEARVYAEDPERDFLPATGTLVRLRAPPPAPDLRIETGVREGDRVTPFYDPMIAKLVAWGADRAAAIHRLADGLSQYRIAGVTTNRDFLLRLTRQPDFIDGAVDTGFIPRHRIALAAPAAPEAAYLAASRALIADEKPAASGDPHSPWAMRDGWRLDGPVAREIGWREGDGERVVSIRDGDIAMPRVADEIDVVRIGSRFTVIDGNGSWQLDYVDPWADRADVAAAGGRLTAPMPGKIVQVLARSGETVKRGQPILILEAMKMEHTIAAPADGIVDAINYAVGELVDEGAVLIGFTPAAG
ncbi:MAG TPA: acetyl-CoA carboxylase biotin carboxylase subunit [Stellaceae bacterium]